MLATAVLADVLEFFGIRRDNLDEPFLFVEVDNRNGDRGARAVEREFEDEFAGAASADRKRRWHHLDELQLVRARRMSFAARRLADLPFAATASPAEAWEHGFSMTTNFIHEVGSLVKKVTALPLPLGSQPKGGL